MSHSQFHSTNLFILRHAWLNLWDKHMTTGRINQVTFFFSKRNMIHTRASLITVRNRHPLHPTAKNTFHKAHKETSNSSAAWHYTWIEKISSGVWFDVFDFQKKRLYIWIEHSQTLFLLSAGRNHCHSSGEGSWPIPLPKGFSLPVFRFP